MSVKANFNLHLGKLQIPQQVSLDYFDARNGTKYHVLKGFNKSQTVLEGLLHCGNLVFLKPANNQKKIV